MNSAEIEVVQLLHDTRTAYLRDLNVAGKTLISTGANGVWYFDWVHSNSGYPARHIGVEFYFPKPDGLPENVEWIANTAGDMHAIDDGVGDILFSGQNIEHLWEEDVVGFLVEANRVLRPGGLLVVDSPNRALTEAFCIVHPEHMVEITPAEMGELLSAAGFEVTRRRGIYLCRDPRNGNLLSYQPHAIMGGNWSLSERLALSDAHIDHCYLWWIEARKTGRADKEALQALVRRYWDIGWRERMNRLQSEVGIRRNSNGIDAYCSATGSVGAVIYGPYSPLKAGRYRVTAQISLTESVDNSAIVGTLDIVLSDKVVSELDIKADKLSIDKYREIGIEFETVLDTTFGFQWRVISNGSCGLKVARDTRIERIS